MGRILVAEDEDGLRTFFSESLTRAGHEVVGASDGTTALALFREGGFDVFLTDLRLPGRDGMTLVRTARAEQPDVEVIIITAFGAVSSAVEALKLGAFDYLEKPIASPAILRELVAAALRRRAQLQGNTSLRSDPHLWVPQLTWGATAMAPVVDALRRVAKTSATVLLQGESGTGKEIAARAIHAASPRHLRPFVAINCAVLSEPLLESELFGHEKGAFTGAHAQRQGRVELAAGGTFFLDEIAELRPALQAKLLRVLEERRFERVGGSKSIDVDVRWIAATHRDLRTMVEQGAFREDLYHRLAVFPIVYPPLRERRDDILPIAHSLLAHLAEAAGRPPPTLADEAKARIREGAWPGNVRELRNALERAMILDDGPILGPENFSAPHVPAQRSSGDEEHSLEALERRAIEQALAAVAGNRRDAAARLGIGLRTLYDKLKRYRIGASGD
ncbi:MAG: sigma-54 dependent transcriptional regulator [Polyangiaceae bacterium]|jgi:DNA-binding NtrC family response regulator|nr:sigma-54 dependent transcriptional regulator [Polyangiaceae bacterium]